MQSNNQPNEITHPLDLQTLAARNSESGPILSLYLDLRPGSGPVLDRFETLMQQARQQSRLDQAPTDYQEHFYLDADRIYKWLESTVPGQAEGVAVFSCQSINLWTAVLLPAPVMDRLSTSNAPYVRPLAVLMAEFQCTLVVLIDPGVARFVEVFLGKATEVDQMESVPVTGGWAEDNPHIEAVLTRIEEIWQERSCSQLVIGGHPETVLDLQDALPEWLRARLAGEAVLSPQASLDMILAEVQGIDEDWEQRIEAEHVQELITTADEGGPAVTGLEQTLSWMRMDKVKNVRLLLVEEDFHHPGGECPNCGYLEEDETITECPICTMSLRPERDVVEIALKRVLDAGGRIDVLRGTQTRTALEDVGHIGALLHHVAHPTEKDATNRMPLTTDGEINRQVVRDETVEESFPASDPPSSW